LENQEDGRPTPASQGKSTVNGVWPSEFPPRKYLGAVGHAGDRNAAVRKSVFDGKSLPPAAQQFCAIIGPAEKKVIAWRQMATNSGVAPLCSGG